MVTICAFQKQLSYVWKDRFGDETKYVFFFFFVLPLLGFIYLFLFSSAGWGKDEGEKRSVANYVCVTILKKNFFDNKSAKKHDTSIEPETQ